MVMVTQTEKYCSRYSIPRTLPYFSNFNPNAVTYKHYYDIEGNHFRGGGSKHARSSHQKSSPSRRLQLSTGAEYGVRFVDKTSTGNVKSISVNDLLDQHLSRLTLRKSSGGRQRKAMNKSKYSRADLDSAGSVDSILTRQAQAIEKGNILRKKDAVVKPPSSCISDGKPTRRLQLEPSIVTLVHITHTDKKPGVPPYNHGDQYHSNHDHGNTPSDTTSNNPSNWNQDQLEQGESTPNPIITQLMDQHIANRQKIPSPVQKLASRSLLEEPNQVEVSSSVAKSPTPNQPKDSSENRSEQSSLMEELVDREVLIPDCTTVYSVFVKQTPPESPACTGYHYKCKHGRGQDQALLCEKVRYNSKGKSHTAQPRRVGENPKSARIKPQPTTSYSRGNHPRSSAKHSPHTKPRVGKKKNSKPARKNPPELDSDIMRGFGPWVTEPDSELLSSVPRSRSKL